MYTFFESGDNFARVSKVGRRCTFKSAFESRCIVMGDLTLQNGWVGSWSSVKSNSVVNITHIPIRVPISLSLDFTKF